MLIQLVTVLCINIIIVATLINGARVEVTLVASSFINRPDGVLYNGLAYNNSIPGPEIHLRQGDTLILRVINHLPNNATTSLHLHGILQQNNNGNDGVPEVTQCGIPNGHDFIYETIIDQDSGTFWYHSHSSYQRGEGLYGALIVHPSSKEIASIAHVSPSIPLSTPQITNDAFDINYRSMLCLSPIGGMFHSI
jgi:FtsP/CotA-like multicopper oxidase with cupredoxin domain